MKLPLWSRIVCGFIGIFFTVAGGAWTAFKVFQLEIESGKNEAIAEAKAGEKRVMDRIDNLRSERNNIIKAQDEKFTVALSGVQSQLNSMDRKLEILIRRTSQVPMERGDNETVFYKLPSDVRRNSL